MSTFPTVATVIGLSKEVAESGPLLATLAIDHVIASQKPKSEPVDIKASDPVTQAVVDNIIGKLPTKKEQVKLKCEVCNVTVSSEQILQTHIAGAKHARKLKGQELIKEINISPHSQFVASNNQNGSGSNVTEFTCKICNIKVNSHQQLQQHLSGTKHKNKAEANEANTLEVSVPSSEKGVASVDVGPNRLYCAACNVNVNSDLQLHQHITSFKHANKVNGRASTKSYRVTPYKRQGRGGANNSWLPTWSRQKAANTTLRNSSSGMGLSGQWGQSGRYPGYNKPFLSGGLLY